VDINANERALAPHMTATEASFFERLAKCGLIWPFSEFNVPTWLQPHLERFVFMEQHPSSAHHKTRSRDVDKVRQFLHWSKKHWDLSQRFSLCRNST
jgi:hypothetical protein